MEQGKIMPLIPKLPKTNFMNVIRITEVKDIDYILQFLNNFNGESFVFKVYKDVFDKAMEIRTIIDLKVQVTSDKEEEELKKEKMEKKITSVYMQVNL